MLEKRYVCIHIEHDQQFRVIYRFECYLVVNILYTCTIDIKGKILNKQEKVGFHHPSLAQKSSPSALTLPQALTKNR